MGVDDVEERFGDLGEIVIDLEMNSRCQEGETLQQPLYVGILAFVRLELEP